MRILERVRAGSGVDREASYGVQAGLLAIALVGITLATFGPFFFLSLAYVLMAAAGAIALLGWRWDDRVLHLARTRSRVRTDAQIGRILSTVSLLFVVYYSGLWILLAVTWPIVLLFGLLAWSAHRARVAARDPSTEAGA